MRIVGSGTVASPVIPSPELLHGSWWSFDRRMKAHTGSSVGFYRDQLDLIRPDKVNARLLNLTTSILHNLLTSS